MFSSSNKHFWRYTGYPIPSGCLRDAFGISQTTAVFLGKRDSKLPTYPSYTLNVPSGLLESILNLSSFLLPSFYLLPTFFLPTILYLPKEYFPHNLSQIQNFQVQKLSTANCELQYTLHRTFLEATPLLPSCYPLTIPLLSLRSIFE